MMKRIEKNLDSFMLFVIPIWQEMVYNTRRIRSTGGDVHGI